jgi:hypothetical protein
MDVVRVAWMCIQLSQAYREKVQAFHLYLLLVEW